MAFVDVPPSTVLTFAATFGLALGSVAFAVFMLVGLDDAFASCDGVSEPEKNAKYAIAAKTMTSPPAIKPRTGDGFFAVTFGLTGVELLPIPLPFHPAIVHLIS